MPTLIILFIFFIIGMMVGAIRSYRLIVASRKAGQRPDTHRDWLEEPLPPWRYEPYPTTAIIIHNLAVLVLGFLALRVASMNGILNSPLYINDINIIVLGWFAQCGSISIVGYQLGAVLIALPLIVFRREPVSIAITEKGVGLGQYFMPWHWFSHFSIDRTGGILRLYSAFALDLPSLTLKPPESIPLVEVEDMIHRFLPLQPLDGIRAWYRTKFLLVPTMLLECLLVIAAGWLVSRLSRELALYVIALLTVILVFLGGQCLNLFAFGIFTSRKNSSRQPPAA